MPKMVVLSQAGKELHEITLADTVFGIEPNQQCIFDAIVMQRASMRQGTHDTKNRTEVRGGGRKPWRQKGTGLRVRVPSVLHSGEVAERYSVLHQEAMHTS